ncbi:MAG: nucleoside-diphosphate kinase [Candidatus Margulisbacteria bacterium]|nr:nucleoside-diphosphate kinase [Candidatus Margulisiibacteriota bacterium]
MLLIKPDGVARGLIDTIIKRVEAAGLKVETKKQITLTGEQAAELYRPHLGKQFYPGLVKFISSGPVMACIVSGEQAISRLRALMGDTDPLAAERGTIRGDLKEMAVINEDGIIKNLVHGSDSLESAAREMPIFFK